MSRSPDHPITRSSDAVVIPRLYAIIDPAQAAAAPPCEIAAALLAAGVRLIQLRDKHASSGELYASAQRVAECVRKAGGIFIVNDRADVARAVDADGVHVGQDDLPVESARVLVGPGKSDRLFHARSGAGEGGGPFHGGLHCFRPHLSHRQQGESRRGGGPCRACVKRARPRASRWWPSEE